MTYQKLDETPAVMGTPMIGGVFVLANTILGAGMLGLPFAFASCGFLVGPLMLLAFAVCSSTALILLSECADRVGRPATFNSVAEKAIPGVGVIFDTAIAIKCFGVATSYLIVIGDSVPKAIAYFGATGILLERKLWTLAALSIAAPLAYAQKITALRYVSYVALTCVLGITVVIVLFALEPTPAFDPCAGHGDVADAFVEEEVAGGPCRGPVVLVTPPMSILRALPLFVFSYTCHQNIFSITNELANPTPSRNASVAAIAVTIALCVYMVLGTSGYATFGSLVAKDILTSYPTSSLVVSIARLSISLVVTSCYPLQAHPSRACVTTILKACGSTMDAGVTHVLITTVFILTTASIALAISDLGLVLSVVGATGSTIISYVLPGASYFLLFPERKSRWLGFVLLCLGLCIMPLSLYLIFFT